MTEKLDWLTTNQTRYNRPNGWVTLDKAWARALGVHRDRGVYRIRHRELLRRLDPLAEARALAGTWTIDPVRTKVGFTAPHLVIAKVHGGFREVSGSLQIGTGPTKFSVDVTVATSSIDTGQAPRDAHLRSADFLDAENHPEMRFRSTDLQVCGPRSCKVNGELTLRGVTQPLTLDVDLRHKASNAGGGSNLSFEARASIDREDFGLVWNRRIEAGGVLIGRHIDLQIDAEAVAA
jgi:polyisoprenoid-binding protein YceI